MPTRPPMFRNPLASVRKPWGSTTGSSHSRGYGARWRALRALVLREQPLCQECLRQARTAAATTVDHVTPKAHGGTDARDNLQALCHDCHKAKTARERLNP